MKVGLVLEGGAMRGLYTAGVLDIFLDNDIKVDGIIGVSAGALFGVNYVSKQRGRCIRYNKKYMQDKRFVSFKSLIKTGNIINKDFAYYEVPLKLDIFDNETFMKSDIDFYATVTNVDTGKPEYIKIEDCVKDLEVFRASSAIPLASKIIEVEGKKYLDGGLSDSIPIDKCQTMGYDKIIVVLTRPIEYRKTKHNYTFLKSIYKDYPNLIETMNNRYQMYNDTVEKIIDLENKKEIFVIRPSEAITIKRLEKDPDKLQEVYDLGVKDCKNSMKELLKYLNN